MKLSSTELGSIKRVNKKDDFYDCPFCGDQRGRLGVLREKSIFHCFNCNASGRLRDLPTLGGFEHQVRSKLGVSKELKLEPQLISLPLECHKIPKQTITMAKKYLLGRGMTEADIERFDIRYTITGIFAHRIIVPIKENGLIKYFVGRTYVNDTPKYMNAAAPKDGLIFKTFNERVNEAVICEGVFDAFSIHKVFPAISLLGKTIAKKQIDTIINCTKKAIVMLDSDAKVDGFKLYQELSYYLPTKIKFIPSKDPGEMDEQQLKEILDHENLQLI